MGGLGECRDSENVVGRSHGRCAVATLDRRSDQNWSPNSSTAFGRLPTLDSLLLYWLLGSGRVRSISNFVYGTIAVIGRQPLFHPVHGEPVVHTADATL